VDLLWLSTVGLLVVHELDAIHQKEWRFFQALLGLEGRVSDETFYRIFTGLHLPLLVVILWWGGMSRGFQIGFDLFAVVHLGLHIGLRNHPLVTFNNPFSFTVIGGAALCGAVHAALLLV
jgi:hypothetical protein